MTVTEVVGGKNVVLEILKARRRRCHEIFLVQGKKEKIVALVESEAKSNNIPIRNITLGEMNSLCSVLKHQGIAARVDAFQFTPVEKIVKIAKDDPSKGFIVVLDGVLDPHNLGSLIRSAHILGVHGVILPKDNSAPLSPTAVKTSAGACEYLPIAQVTNIVNALKDLKTNDFWVVGAEGTSKDNIYRYDFKGNNYVLVLGGEGKGIRRLVRETCDHLLSIPMLGSVASYNVSVAGAIFMAEIMRQRYFKN